MFSQPVLVLRERIGLQRLRSKASSFPGALELSLVSLYLTMPRILVTVIFGGG